MATFGDFFKAKRLALGLTLRNFCMTHSLDPGNISKLERGRLLPPQSSQKLREYARMLKIKPGSKDWQTFLDLAAAEAGRIPEDLLSDEEVIGKLPVLFRTLRGQKLSDEEISGLMKMIKEG